MRVRASSLLGLCCLVAPTTAQVALPELPQLARARAERLRPVQEQALKPYWADLALSYPENAQYLDGRITALAQLGDSVVPLLLEKLTPADSSHAARQTAANCRRVLEKLDPTTFVDALVELATGSNEVAREQALRLLGLAQSPRAVQVLVEALSGQRGEAQKIAIAGLTRQKAVEAARLVVGMLGSDDRALRQDVLEYLKVCKASAVADTVLAALALEKDNRLLGSYIDYCAAALRENEAAAMALLPLLDTRERLDTQDTLRLVEALAVVAPSGHAAVQKKLRDIIDGGDTGSLGLQAALTLQALGDKTGLVHLRKNLDEQLRNPRRNKEASLFELRGNLYVAVENWKEATDDYEKALELSQGATTLATRRLRKQLIRCAAHKRLWSQVVKHGKDAELTLAEMQELAQLDPAVQEALGQEKVRLWLQSLPVRGPEKAADK